MSNELENRFTHHPPQDEYTISVYKTIRDEAKSYAYLLDALVPDSREKSTALTKLDEVVFWANAGIARNGANQ